MKSVHSLNVVHGNIKIVCPSSTLRFSRGLMASQTNILVNAEGRAHLAGLGVASAPYAVSGVDVDRFFHGAAPELVNPRRSRLSDARATQASDVYAFGVLTWEVSRGRVILPDTF